jgi:hypothetical protein
VAGVALLVLVQVLSGCESRVVTSDGRPLPPDPRPLPPPPVQVKAAWMTVRLGTKAVDDRNGNGYPEIIPVETYLFSPQYPEGTIHEAGAFVFMLYVAGRTGAAGAEALAQWRFDGEALERAKMYHPLFGLGYAFRLDLLEAGGDEYPLLQASLVCRFEPADGREAIGSSDSYPIQIGRRLGVG